MGLDDFMDVLGKLNRLTPAQKRAVAEVLAEGEETPAEVLKPAYQPSKPINHNKPITDLDRHEFARYAHACLRVPLRNRNRIYNQAAREMGRGYESVRCEILKAIRSIHQENKNARKDATQ